jgi:hypothetical protein
VPTALKHFDHTEHTYKRIKLILCVIASTKSCVDLGYKFLRGGHLISARPFENAFGR